MVSLNIIQQNRILNYHKMQYAENILEHNGRDTFGEIKQSYKEIDALMQGRDI
jgi:hypothetical protein